MTKLKDITLKIVDGVHGDCENEENSGYFFVSVKDLSGYYIDYANARQITFNDYTTAHKRTELEEYDVLFANSGHTIGKMLQAKKHTVKLGYTTFQKSVALLKPDISIVDPDYFYYLIKFNVEGLRKAAVGSAQKNLLLDDIRNFKIDIKHKYEIQNRTILSMFLIDKTIELNNKINTELEAMAKTIYDYWFLQFDFPNEEGKPYRSSGGKMVWNEQIKREIPDGWRVDKLADKLNFLRGVEPGSSAYLTEKTNTHSIPFIRVSDLGKDTALNILLEDAMDIYCESENILVSFDGTVGKVALAMEGAYSSGIRKITPKDGDYSNALIYFIFRSKEVQSTISKYAVGSNILHASSSIEHLIFLYDDAIVGQFQKIIEPLYKIIVANHRENKELAKLLDWLLPMLMNGQVTVK